MHLKISSVYCRKCPVLKYILEFLTFYNSERYLPDFNLLLKELQFK